MKSLKQIERLAIIKATKKLSLTAKSPLDLRRSVSKVLKVSPETVYRRLRSYKVVLKKQPNVKVVVG